MIDTLNPPPKDTPKQKQQTALSPNQKELCDKNIKLLYEFCNRTSKQADVKSLGEFDDYVSYMTDGYLAAIRNWKEEMHVTIGHYCFTIMFRRIKRYKELKYKRYMRYRQHATEETEQEIESYRKGDDSDTKEEINHILEKVKSEKTLEMIQKKFGLNGERKHTLKELTEYYGMPTETIRIRIQRELKKLRGKNNVNRS